MNNRPGCRFRPFALSMLIVLMLITGGVTPVTADDPHQDIPTVDPVLLAQSKRSDTLDYLIVFKDQADLSAAYDMDWETRGWYVYQTLTAHAEESQARVHQYLDNTGVSYQSYWAQNSILVESSSHATLNGLLIYTEIKTLQSIPQVMLTAPKFIAEGNEQITTKAVTSNLTHISADDAWVMGITGEGLVVGSIDTGARFTHDALVSQYRGHQGEGTFDHNYHWWDAIHKKNSPYDDNGHGSHVTGIMIGSDGADNQIGVAPQAAWIACKAFDQDGDSLGSYLLSCGQFMLAPWDLTENNHNPNKRPHVVNNSWGDCSRSYELWFESTIDAWLAAGIYPVFASGNNSGCGYSTPPGLNTVGNPARSHHVTAVGSTGNNNGQYATHSNWGPTDNLDTINPNGYPDLKPQVVAPGVNIQSAVETGDAAYATSTGTSMAAPHVAGLVALMWQAGPCLVGNYATTETLMEQTATPILFDDGSPNTPGHPNYATGWGEIDVLAAVTKARETCGDVILKGIVKDSETQQVLPATEISVKALNNHQHNRVGFTNHEGYYEILVVNGERYDMTAFKDGYKPFVISDVDAATSGESITNDFNLTKIILIDYFLPLFLR
jgi:subtilisin family serine protease